MRNCFPKKSDFWSSCHGVYIQKFQQSLVILLPHPNLFARRSSIMPNLLTIFGGTGFLARQVLRHLSRTTHAPNLHIRLAAPHPIPIDLKSLAPSVPSITQFTCDISDPAQVTAALKDATHVLNTVGILYETPSHGITFHKAHVQGPANIATALNNNRIVQRMVHISAIGANPTSKSVYASTKAAGEANILSIPKSEQRHVTILRPSIMFGPEDSFFNRFNSLTKVLPFLPLVGGGTTLYQPVHVSDVASAIATSLALSDKQMQIPSHSVYELGGANTLNFRQLMELLLKASGKRRVSLPIPFCVATLQGGGFELMHRMVPSIPPMLTRDQVQLLRYDNVVAPGAKTFGDLGITARGCTLEEISYVR